MRLFSGGISRDTTVGLTPLGKSKAERVEGVTKKGEVIIALNERGESTIAEIAEETHLSANTVKTIVKSLIKSNMVRTSKGED